MVKISLILVLFLTITYQKIILGKIKNHKLILATIKQAPNADVKRVEK